MLLCSFLNLLDNSTRGEVQEKFFCSFTDFTARQSLLIQTCLVSVSPDEPSSSSKDFRDPWFLQNSTHQIKECPLQSFKIIY